MDTDHAYIPKANKIDMGSENSEGFVIYLSVKTEAFIFREKGEERRVHTSLSFNTESRRQLIPFNKCSLRHSLTGIKDIFINFLYI